MSGLYIHIPFCKQRCLYCDFYSTVGQQSSGSEYVETLINEFKHRKHETDFSGNNTIYVGGGTPSQLQDADLQRLMNEIHSSVRNIEEATIEVNPEDVTIERASMWKGMGFDRASMGVQSFVDSELRFINRRHTTAKAISAFSNLRNARFDNVSIDLMYGLPGQTPESWANSVSTAIKLQPEHISAYSLMIVEGTPLFKLRERGVFTDVDDTEYIKMYEHLVSELASAGYEHYEISNFALPGMYSKHNSSYWNLTPYIGLGASAHSWDGFVRRANPNDLRLYITDIKANGTAYAEEHESMNDIYNDYILTSLRTKWGVDKTFLKRTFGNNLFSFFMANAFKYVKSGALIENDGTVKVAENAMMTSDAIIRDLIYTE